MRHQDQTSQPDPTPAQQAQTPAPTPAKPDSVELTTEELEERIAPRKPYRF
jgi:hypothetical protein